MDWKQAIKYGLYQLMFMALFFSKNRCLRHWPTWICRSSSEGAATCQIFNVRHIQWCQQVPAFATQSQSMSPLWRQNCIIVRQTEAGKPPLLVSGGFLRSVKCIFWLPGQACSLCRKCASAIADAKATQPERCCTVSQLLHWLFGSHCSQKEFKVVLSGLSYTESWPGKTEAARWYTTIFAIHWFPAELSAPLLHLMFGPPSVST